MGAVMTSLEIDFRDPMRRQNERLNTKNLVNYCRITDNQLLGHSLSLENDRSVVCACGFIPDLKT